MKIKTFHTSLYAVVFLSLFSFSPVYGAPSSEHKAPVVSQIIDKPFLEAVSFVETHLDRLYYQIAGFKVLPQIIVEQWQRIAETQSPLLLLAVIVLIILLGFLAEYVVRRSLKSLHSRLAHFPDDELFLRIWNTFFSICLEIFYAGTFIVTAFVFYILLGPSESEPIVISSNYIIASYYLRLLFLISTVMLSPARPKLRILPYTDDVAQFMFRWFTLLYGLEVVLVRSGIILRRLNAPENTFLALVSIIIVSSAIALAIIILKIRPWVTKALVTHHSDQLPILPIQVAFARVWHIPALFLIFGVTCIWELRVIGSGQILFGRVIVGVLAIPLFGALDIWGGYLFSSLFRKSGFRRKSIDDNLQKAETNRRNLITYLQYTQIVYRILLLTLLVFLLLGLWDLDIPYGRMFTGSLLGLVAIVVISYMVWQLFADWIDHRIKAEMPVEDEEADEGGKGGSRTGTLLILLRKFVLSVLVVLAVMFILSTLGVNIGPLIAGAGILGLAISFGAQSLVTDIFAGIFFLVDDAFRVGDYIDIGTAKGTVDHISLRSVRLRHHLGMVQTIPFGKIDTVTNYSRDFIITKLDLRIRYDTDINKVRKLVKRIYNDIMLDEIYGPKLLGKLKSQGIKQMDDSAMIIRIKFTTPPGEQFIMRREIFRRIQEAFAAHNIEFAHRNVTVYMPSDEQHQPDARALAGGAAAGRILLDEEESDEVAEGGDDR